MEPFAWDEYQWENGIGRFFKEIERVDGTVDLILVMELDQPLLRLYLD